MMSRPSSKLFCISGVGSTFNLLIGVDCSSRFLRHCDYSLQSLESTPLNLLVTVEQCMILGSPPYVLQVKEIRFRNPYAIFQQYQHSRRTRDYGNNRTSNYKTPTKHILSNNNFRLSHNG